MFKLSFVLMSFIQDFNMLLKIYAIISLVSFLLQYTQNKKLIALIVVIFAYFMFSNWWFFGSIFFIYLFLSTGAAAFFIDLFFVWPGREAQTPKEIEKKIPETTGAGVAQRYGAVKQATAYSRIMKRVGR